MSKRVIYLAAPWVNRVEASAAKRKLIEAGHEVPARWIDDHEEVLDNDPVAMRKQAEEDLIDLRKADTFIILNLNKSEGKATELGYALCSHDALSSPEIFMVGEITNNIFYYLPEVNVVATLEELIERLIA